MLFACLPVLVSCVCVVLLVCTGSRPVQIQVDFIRLKSYEDTQSSGDVRVVGIDNLEQLQGKVRKID